MAHSSWVRLRWNADVPEMPGLHPDDVPLASAHPPHPHLLAEVGRDGDFLCLRYSAGVIRVKPEATEPVEAPAFDYDQIVTSRPPRTPVTGTIHRIEWHPSTGMPRYTLSVQGQERSGSSYRDGELQVIEPPRAQGALAERFPFHVLAAALGTFGAVVLYGITPGRSAVSEALRVGHPALAVAIYMGAIRGITAHLLGRRGIAMLSAWVISIAFVVILAAELAMRLRAGGLWASLIVVGVYELSYWASEAVLALVSASRPAHKR